jgi:hypothetical protein
MKVFIDSNVLLDVVLKREPFYDESLFVMEWCVKNASSNHIAVAHGHELLLPLTP